MQIKHGLDRDGAQKVASKWLKIADLDGNGTLDLEEFKIFVSKSSGSFSESQAVDLFN